MKSSVFIVVQYLVRIDACFRFCEFCLPIHGPKIDVMCVHDKQ